MDASYELWNVEAGNIIGSFATFDEGMDVVQRLVDRYGLSYARELCLSRRIPQRGVGDRPARILADGDQLVAILERPKHERSSVTATHPE